MFKAVHDNDACSDGKNGLHSAKHVVIKKTFANFAAIDANHAKHFHIKPFFLKNEMADIFMNFVFFVHLYQF